MIKMESISEYRKKEFCNYLGILAEWDFKVWVLLNVEMIVFLIKLNGVFP